MEGANAFGYRQAERQEIKGHLYNENHSFKSTKKKKKGKKKKKRKEKKAIFIFILNAFCSFCPVC